ncbi:hypothetical protein C1645_818072 [Glomus cerebriforme]|uniref:Uncharacterized protein n=1 Tax=Glomus cerebriforme TaxID=658196 RepID=A0A397TD36_9GLOM|nr:hypothetical protein C1645_818072 [Glomus cerebriforme]
MSSEEQKAVEITCTAEIAELTNIENQQTEISESIMPVKQTQQTTNSTSTNSKSKKKFVIGTEESPKDNKVNNDSTSNMGIQNDSKENVESHTDTKQKIDSEEEDDYVNITKKVSTQIISEPQPPQQPIQQPTPKEEKVNEMNSSESSKPTTMTPTHQAAPVVTNTTVTATTQRQSSPLVKQSAKFILSTPDSPDSTPISSPSDDIHNASYVNPSVLKLDPNPSQNPIQPNHILDSYMFPSTLEDSYTSEPLNYPHQPRFPPSSGGLSRTQQKILLQRQHFLADDENYLVHPRNQLRLTKVIERINREHAAISLYREPIIESLQRVWPKYVQEHPEVLEDDFGVGYEDAKEWGVISDHGKSVDHIGSNSIISTETLGVDSMPLRGIK